VLLELLIDFRNRVPISNAVIFPYKNNRILHFKGSNSVWSKVEFAEKLKE